MKRFLTICICVFLCVGCTHQGGGNTGTSSTSETVVTTTTPVTTPVVDIPMPEYHEELMSGDFSAIAGTYENSQGVKIYINSEGRQYNIGHAGKVSYSKGVYSVERLYNQSTRIYPVGVEVLSNDKIIETDTSKLRTWTGYDDPEGSYEIYTKISDTIEGLPSYHDAIIDGDFSDIVGEYKKPNGDSFYLNANGLSDSSSNSLGEVFYNRGLYRTNVYNPSGEGVGFFIYPVGQAVTYQQGMFQIVVETDISKVRLAFGNAEIVSNSEVYTKVDEEEPLITITPTIESEPLKDGVYKCQQYDYRYTEVIIEDGKFSFGFYDYTDGRSENRVEGNVVELHKDLYYLALDDKNKEVYSKKFYPLILRVIDNEVYTIDINTYYIVAEDAEYNVIEGYWDDRDLPTAEELMNFLYVDYLEKCEYIIE
ncbi:MAG: hypothetical protein E7191_04815 [Erysipelotrichaceae bacterium]|nr:hypothetical protein [Erysipelotrichaceae bacterium]